MKLTRACGGRIQSWPRFFGVGCHSVSSPVARSFLNFVFFGAVVSHVSWRPPPLSDKIGFRHFLNLRFFGRWFLMAAGGGGRAGPAAEPGYRRRQRRCRAPPAGGGPVWPPRGARGRVCRRVRCRAAVTARRAPAPAARRAPPPPAAMRDGPGRVAAPDGCRGCGRLTTVTGHLASSAGRPAVIGVTSRGGTTPAAC